MGGEPVGAAALTGRLSLPRRRPATDAGDAERLAFDRTGGPLVVACGLAGGAGTSTLAYQLARSAARHSAAPVLLGELGAGGGLAAIAETASPLCLRELARAADEGRAPAQPFVELAGGLRLVASADRAEHVPLRAGALERLLEDARAAHGLVVVDAGQLAPGEVERLLALADHVLLCLPATPAGLRRAQLDLDAGLLRRSGGVRAALVCSAIQPAARAQVRELRRLAEGRVERLLLVPHRPRLARGQLDEGAFDSTLTALATMLRGRR
jgi:Flp pilus assembly CpaE family ATPase